MAQSIITVPTPPTKPTTAQLLQAEANNLAIQQQNAFRTVVSVFTATTRYIWGDLTPGTPQTKFTAFSNAGYKASDLVMNAQAAIALVAALTGVTPPSPVPAGYSLTINGDSTVTVVEPTPPTP